MSRHHAVKCYRVRKFGRTSFVVLGCRGAGCRITMGEMRSDWFGGVLDPRSVSKPQISVPLEYNDTCCSGD